MYIYNLTAHIDPTIDTEWLHWIKLQIVAVLETEQLSKVTLTQVLVADRTGARTYAIQYRARSEEALATFYQNDAKRIRLEGVQKFGDKMLIFETELKIIEEYGQD